MKPIKGNTHDNRPKAASQPETERATDAKACPTRLCIICRTARPRDLLVRLTADNQTGEIKLNKGKPPVEGRSVYFCRKQSCLTQLLKGTRLKLSLEGRKGKNLQNRRTIKWPVEPQLILEITAECTEP
jgi:predicted RNA-binding protein YlxR (DUF448 family)